MPSKLGAYTAVVAGGIFVYSAVTGRSVADIVMMRQSPSTSPTSVSGTANASGTSSSAPTGSAPGSGSVQASLFPQGTQVKVQRHDQGRDLQVTPPVNNILAIGNGTCLRNGFDPAGFGISYPICHFNDGPWSGLDIYFGHTKSLLRPGQSFQTGQPISQTQDGSGPYVGNATGLPGWTEIGLAPNGSPGPLGQPTPPGL